MIAEVETLRQTDHENIIKLYHVYEEDDYIYLVFEYIEGV